MPSVSCLAKGASSPDDRPHLSCFTKVASRAVFQLFICYVAVESLSCVKSQQQNSWCPSACGFRRRALPCSLPRPPLLGPSKRPKAKDHPDGPPLDPSRPASTSSDRSLGGPLQGHCSSQSKSSDKISQVGFRKDKYCVWWDLSGKEVLKLDQIFQVNWFSKYTLSVSRNETTQKKRCWN